MRKDYKALKVGKEFDLYQARRSHLREWTRTIIALLIVVACLAALGLAALFGAQSGDDPVLLKVWAVVAVPLTAVTTYYFKGSKRGGEDDD